MDHDMIIPTGASRKTKKRILKKLLVEKTPHPMMPRMMEDFHVCGLGGKCLRPKEEERWVVGMNCCNRSVHGKCLADYWYKSYHRRCILENQRWYSYIKDYYKCPFCFRFRFTVNFHNRTMDLDEILWYLTCRFQMNKWL